MTIDGRECGLPAWLGENRAHSTAGGGESVARCDDAVVSFHAISGM